MTEEQLQQASLDDIVFEFRNKAPTAGLPHDTAQRLHHGDQFVYDGDGYDEGVSHRTWSYLSPWGMVCLIGLSGVTFVVVSWYLQYMRQQQLSTR